MGGSWKAGASGGGTVTAGTTNSIPKYTGSTSLGNSSITDNGTTVATPEAFSQGGGKFTLSSAGAITAVDGVPTTGIGVSAVVATSENAGSTGGGTVINYTPASNASLYRVCASIQVEAATTANFQVVIVHNDMSGTSRTVDMAGYSPSGAALTNGAITNTTGVGAYQMVTYIFGVDNSGTAITVSLTGTFTSVTYNYFISLERLA